MEMGWALRARLRPLFEHAVAALRSWNKAVRIGRDQRPRKVLGRRIRRRRRPDQYQEETTEVIRPRLFFRCFPSSQIRPLLAKLARLREIARLELLEHQRSRANCAS